MADGVIPSKEFNEQLKRTVRENLRRERGRQPRQGRWHKKKSSHTGIVLFEIDSFVYGLECEACNATVIMKGCNTTAGESIEVYDEAGCFFDVPEEILEGQRGFAVRMKDPSGYEGCKWVVMSLCCTEG